MIICVCAEDFRQSDGKFWAAFQYDNDGEMSGGTVQTANSGEIKAQAGSIAWKADGSGKVRLANDEETWTAQA